MKSYVLITEKVTTGGQERRHGKYSVHLIRLVTELGVSFQLQLEAITPSRRVFVTHESIMRLANTHAGFFHSLKRSGLVEMTVSL